MNDEELRAYYLQRAQEAETGTEQEDYIKSAEKLRLKIIGRGNKP